MPTASARVKGSGSTGATKAGGGAKAAKARRDKAVSRQTEGGSVGRFVIYPDLVSQFCLGANAITEEQAMALLDWETESEFAARKKKEDQRLSGSELEFGDNYTCKALNGEKVRCWNCSSNRPFDEGTAKKYAQDVLNRHWADSRNGGLVKLTVKKKDGSTEDRDFPTMTVNGESIIIGRTGEVLSGQHRLIGLVYACQTWRGKNKERWAKKWPDKPTLEALVVFGVAEGEEVVRTLDNVKTRSLSDVLFTSSTFKGLGVKERAEHSRMLARAVDFLWQRTGAGRGAEQGAHEFQTHSESVEFLSRHPKLLDCLSHLFKCNRDRDISLHKLSPGQCSAAMYLMGSCSSDIDDYGHTEPRPSEKVLKWDKLPSAEKFWTEFAKGEGQMAEVRHAVGFKADEEGDETRAVEKLSVLAKAWGLYVEGKRLRRELLDLRYTPPDKDGVRHIDEWPGFGGIDLGPAHADSKEANGGAEERKDEERQKKAEELRQRAEAIRRGKGKKESPTDGTPAKAPSRPAASASASGSVSATPNGAVGGGGGTPAMSILAEINSVKEDYKGALVAVRGNGTLTFYGADANLVAKALDMKSSLDPQNKTFRIGIKDDPSVVRALLNEGWRIAVVEFRGGERVIKEVKVESEEPAKRPKPATKPKPTGKPKPAGKGK